MPQCPSSCRYLPENLETEASMNTLILQYLAVCIRQCKTLLASHCYCNQGGSRHISMSQSSYLHVMHTDTTPCPHMACKPTSCCLPCISVHTQHQLSADAPSFARFCPAADEHPMQEHISRTLCKKQSSLRLQANITLRQRKATDGRVKNWLKRVIAQPLGFLIHLGHRYLTKLMLTGIECAVEHYLGLIHSPQVRINIYDVLKRSRSAVKACLIG